MLSYLHFSTFLRVARSVYDVTGHMMIRGYLTSRCRRVSLRFTSKINSNLAYVTGWANANTNQ